MSFHNQIVTTLSKEHLNWQYLKFDNTYASAKTMAFSSARKLRTQKRVFILLFALQQIVSIWLWKFYFLSNVMPSNSTVLEDFIALPTKDISLSIHFLAKSISWNFLGFATISLFLSQFIAILTSISSFFETISKFLPYLYKVIPSPKLQTFLSFVKRSKSFKKMWNKIGP